VELRTTLEQENMEYWRCCSRGKIRETSQRNVHRTEIQNGNYWI